MRIIPVTLSQAKQFVEIHHRHNRPPLGWLFGCGLEIDGSVAGVAIAGRPVARGLCDGESIEITRVCTTGHKNANSMLYGSILRAAKSLGYHRAYTYTLQSESGSTLKAVGFRIDESIESRESWSCKSRRRYKTDLFGNETRPQEAKFRWIMNLVKGDQQ